MSSEWPQHTTELKLLPPVEAAQKVMFDGYKAAGTSTDISAGLAWDPGMLVIDAYRKLGLKATPEQIRSYIAGLKDWAGINGIYDFTKMPQRGLNVDDSIVTRWDTKKNAWIIVSKPGGDPL